MCERSRLTVIFHSRDILQRDPFNRPRHALAFYAEAGPQPACRNSGSNNEYLPNRSPEATWFPSDSPEDLCSYSTILQVVHETFHLESIDSNLHNNDNTALDVKNGFIESFSAHLVRGQYSLD